MYFTIVVHYPTTLDALTRWSKGLFAVVYGCGLVGLAALIAGVVLGFMHKPLWLWLGLIVFALALGGVQGLAESLGKEVDLRRYLLTHADDSAEQPAA